MARIVIEMTEGEIRQVYSDIADIEVVKLDWDVGQYPGEKAQVSECWVMKTKWMTQQTKAAISTFYETPIANL
jgi:hypothetical protein